MRTRPYFGPFIAAFISAWISFTANCGPSNSQSKVQADSKPLALFSRLLPVCRATSQTQDLASPAEDTLGMTLFAIVRAVEAFVVCACARGCQQEGCLNPVEKIFSKHWDSMMFAVSSGTIMWAWFYLPGRLPDAYGKWISSAAQVDSRLIDALRAARAGKWKYGEHGGDALRPLQDMCKDYGWPIEWSNPQKTIPLPCEMVHQGAGQSCHWHAIVRFLHTFRFALAANLPVQLLVKVVMHRCLSLRLIRLVAQETFRSSSFLAVFVATMYYSICLSRTLVGPRLASYATISPQRWDSGLSVAISCVTSGMSILIEEKRKRRELAMFVAPRALATLIPRPNDPKIWRRERLAFSLSVATLFSCVRTENGAVRGIFGRVLKSILSG